MNDKALNRPQVGLFSIGTEITTGQILNSNASTLSQNLTDLGLDVVMHITVADDRPKILRSLNLLREQKLNLIVVTGGLGPTSDDFTREVISEWFGEKLNFDESSWQHILQRLQSFGIAVAESNRQQCFFPRSAKILKNSAGTANGFWMDQKGFPKLVCLPGPPREIAAIWRDHLKDLIQSNFLLRKSDQLLRWQCIGKSESALGEIVEAIVKGTKLRTGYRPHVPYVEIKVWMPEDSGAAENAAIDQLNNSLSPWCIAREDEDLAEEFLNRCKTLKHIIVRDYASLGALGRRVLEVRNKFLDDHFPRLDIETLTPSTNTDVDVNFPSADWVIDLKSIPDRCAWQVSSNFRSQFTIQTLEVEYRPNPEHRERFAKMLVEKTLHLLTQLPKSQATVSE